MARLGDWRWYCGSDVDDDEMADCGSRGDAIDYGRQNLDGQFYIVEARMRVADEDAMASGARDSAPFAESRNGEWIT